MAKNSGKVTALVIGSVVSLFSLFFYLAEPYALPCGKNSSSFWGFSRGKPCSHVPTPEPTPTATATATPSPTATPTTFGFTGVWANDGGDVVHQEELRKTQSISVINNHWDGTNVKLWGSKNEVLGFALYLENGNASAINNVTATFTSLSDGGSNSITTTTVTGNEVFNYVGRNIEQFYLRYIPIRGLSKVSYPVQNSYDERHFPLKFQRSYTGSGVVVAGQNWTNRPHRDKYYPEIAVPIETQGLFNVAVNKNQALWFDIYIPRTQAAATYTGNIVIKKNNGADTIHTIPVELVVKNLTLSDTPSAGALAITYIQTSDLMKRTLGITYPLTSSDTNTLYTQFKNVMKMMHRHRVHVFNDDVNFGHTAAPTDQPRPEWAQYLSSTAPGFAAANGYAGPGASTPNEVYVIGAYGTWPWTNTQANWENRSTGWYNYMSANYPDVKPFIYIADESTDFTGINEKAGWVKNQAGNGRNLKTFATNNFADCQASIQNLTMCAQAVQWSLPSATENGFNALIAGGKEAWVYNSHRPLSGTFATEDDGVALRALMIGAAKKQVSGYFFWLANGWRDGACGNNNDLFNDARTWGCYSSDDTNVGRTGFAYSNGDGVLLYPGTDTVFPADSYGLAGPIASIRLKKWRRGIQDAEYMALSRAQCPAATATLVSSFLPKFMWEYPVDDPLDPTYGRQAPSFSTSADAYDNFRNQLSAYALGSCTEPTPTPTASPSPTASPTATASPSPTATATPAGEPAFWARAGTVALNTSTGNQNIAHGGGYAPKGVLFVGTNRTADGGGADAIFSFGAGTSSSARWTAGQEFKDNSSPSSVNRLFDSTKVIRAISNAGGTLYAADLVSFDSTNIVINVTTAPASAYKLNYLALGGTAFGMAVGTKDLAGSNSNQSVSGLAFQPVANIFAISIGNTTEGITTNAYMGLGAAVSSTKEMVSANTCDNGVTANSTRWFKTNASLLRYGPGENIFNVLDFVSNNASGWTINQSAGNGTAPRIGYVSFGGITADLLTFNQNTSTGAQSITGSTSTGWRAAIFLSNSYAVSSDNENSTYGNRMIGVATASNARWCYTISDQNGQSTSNASSYQTGAQALCHIIAGHGSPTLQAAGDFTQFVGQGVELNNGTVDATARSGGVLILGE